MKTFNLHFTNIEEINKFILSNSINNYGNILVQIFSGIIDENLLLNISKTIKQILPTSQILGTTTSGEICEGTMLEEEIIISFSIFEDTKVKSNIYEIQNNNIDLKGILDTLVDDDTKVLIVFSDGIQSNGDEIIKKISELKPEITIAGGRAGDNQVYQKTFIFNENYILESGCIIAALSSKNLIVNSNYLLNWMTIGQDMIITKSDGNILHDINHIKVIDVYKKYLGDDIADGLPNSGIEFPLIFDKNGITIARAPIGITENGSFIFGGNIEVGTKVKFGFGDSNIIKNESYNIHDTLKTIPTESIFIYSCSARKVLIGKDLEVEFEVLQNIAPSVGFFTYGEYYHNENSNELLNITTTFLSLSERDELPKVKKLSNTQIQNNKTLNALTNLVKTTTQELNNTYNILNHAQKISSIGSWDWDIKNNTLWWSDEIYNIFGLNPDDFEATYEAFLNHVHPEDRDILNHTVEKSLKDKNTPYKIKHRVISKDGSIKTVMEQADILRDSNNNPIKMVGVVQDISADEEIKQKLKDSEFRWKFAVEGSGDGLWDWDLTTDDVYFSSQWKKMLGFKDNEITGNLQEWKKRVHPDDIENVFKDLKAHLNGKTKSYENEHRVLCKDGTYKWVLDRGMVVEKDKFGNPLRVIGTHTDIDENKKLKVQLEKEKNSLELLSIEQKNLLSLFDKGDIVLFKWCNNDTWDVEYVSENVETIFGYTVDEFKNGDIAYASMINSQDIQLVTTEVTNAVNDNLDFFKHEPYRTISKSNEEKWIMDYTATQKDEDGNITHFIGYIIDITNQVKVQEDILVAKEKAEAANIAKSDFLANMSHEIRTPLNGIIGLTELMLKTELNSKQREYIDKSISSAKSLLHIINDILDFSKIEAGKLDIEYKPFSLQDVLLSIQDTFDYIADEKGILLNFEYEHLNIEGDSLRLSQILTNLVGNAIKFTNNGSVSLTTNIIKETDDFVKLQFDIKDTGIGISESAQKQLFQKFTQADSSTTREFGGSGLGLAISKKLLDLMNGDIWVKSKYKEGSTFSFSLEFKKVDIAEKIEKNIKSDKIINSFKDKNILVAEDNKTNQLVVMGILEDYGTTLDFANNGKEAVEKFNSNNYDLILMDIQMPVMSGLEATEIIRLTDKDIPIIALTAAVMKEDIEKTKDAKMDALVGKPINQQELIDVISKFI